MHLKPAFKNLFSLVVGITFALSATAQWQWMDKDGRKVFSDRSPPAEVQDKDILKRPAGATRAQAPAAEDGLDKPAAATTSAGAAKPAAPKLSGKDAELEAKKKQAEEQEAAKQKAAEEKVAKAKTENCDRAKTSLATLASGTRIASVNANGEREIMGDDKRAAETKRTQEVIDSDCKK